MGKNEQLTYKIGDTNTEDKKEGAKLKRRVLINRPLGKKYNVAVDKGRQYKVIINRGKENSDLPEEDDVAVNSGIETSNSEEINEDYEEKKLLNIMDAVSGSIETVAKGDPAKKNEIESGLLRLAELQLLKGIEEEDIIETLKEKVKTFDKDYKLRPLSDNRGVVITERERQDIAD